MKEVQSANVQEGYSGQVPEGLGDTVVLLVDDEGSLPHGVTSVPDFANTGSDLRVLRFVYEIVQFSQLIVRIMEAPISENKCNFKKFYNQILPYLPGFFGFLDIVVSSDGLHESDGLLRLGERFDSSFDNTWYFGNLEMVQIK